MGRYYSGDIEGKFWFAVQDSDDADFFGAKGEFPKTHLEYSFNTDHLPQIREGIEICNKKLGVMKEKLDKFFEATNGYNDEIVKDWFKKALNENINIKDFNNALVWYARLELGEKIKKCVEENDYCNFDAEV